MKNIVWYVAVGLLLCAAAQPVVWGQAAPQGPSASEMRELHTSFNALFEAMKDGNVAVIEQYFSGPMGSEYKKLLEENGEYPAFLRDFYRGATFTIARVTPTPEGDVVVDVAIQLHGGSRSITKLHAKRFDGTWKVTNVVNAPRTPPRPN